MSADRLPRKRSVLKDHPDDKIYTKGMPGQSEIFCGVLGGRVLLDVTPHGQKLLVAELSDNLFCVGPNGILIEG